MSKNSAKSASPRDGSETPPLLLIPLQSFRLRHGPQDDAEEDKNGFVGRDELIQKLVKILENTRNSRGSYLIAGYRGVGKTSVMNRVLSYYKNDNYASPHEQLKERKYYNQSMSYGFAVMRRIEALCIKIKKYTGYVVDELFKKKEYWLQLIFLRFVLLICGYQKKLFVLLILFHL